MNNHTMLPAHLLLPLLVTIAGAGCNSPSPPIGGNGDVQTECPEYVDLQAELDNFRSGLGQPAKPHDVMAGPEEYALCDALALRAAECHRWCPPEPREQCALRWGCLRRSLRADMVADIYACMPTLDCSPDADSLTYSSVGSCIAEVAAKYPATQTELAHAEAWAAHAEGCGRSDTSCWPGRCRGWSESYHAAQVACFPSKNCDNWCQSYAHYTTIVDACVPPDPVDAGAPDASGD